MRTRLLAVEADSARLQKELARSEEVRESMQCELDNSEAFNAILRAHFATKQEQVLIKREQVVAATAEMEQATAAVASVQGEVEDGSLGNASFAMMHAHV